MKHILEMTTEEIEYLRQNVFSAIARGDAILFLGAGASVGDKKFLSEQIMQYYADKIGIRLDTHDIVEFVDTLSADRRFDREDFDSYVVDLLGKLNVTNVHKTIARQNWREIITTNCDLVLERAYDDLTTEGLTNLKVKPIKRLGDYSYSPADDEVKYVKLNGCISDPKKYPLVFSTQDFNSANRFYKRVLKSLENLSPRIVFISIGYSFADPFAKSLLNRFDSYKFRSKKWMINVDPYAQDSQLAYFSQNRICVTRLSADQFFQRYTEWEQESVDAKAVRVRTRFLNGSNQTVTVPSDVKVRLGGALVQLSRANVFPSVDQKSFYQGEEPTFDTIRRNHDVIRDQVLQIALTYLKKSFAEKQDLVPIVALKGSYGTGKTTFAYRLMDRLLQEPDLNALGFEVLEPEKVQTSDLARLAQLTQARQMVLVFNRIELDSNFKALVDLRNRISIEQFQEFNVVLVGSIRENILERHKHQHHYANLIELDVDSRLNETEAADLIEKLRDVGLVQYRDARQKQEFVHRVTAEYAGDTFTSLVGLLSNSQHVTYLLSAYNQLPKKAQEAFLYTSLLYRFGCAMPVSLLKKLVSTDWDTFKSDVLEVDCKGVLVQEVNTSSGTVPDLYFRTKHPIISDLLVKYFFPNDDKRYESYLNLVQHLSAGFHNSTLLIDLLKSIRDTSDLSQDKLDRLYDACSQEFGEDPHFTLHYAVNLQHRQDEQSLQDAIDNILHVEGLLDRRNHRLIHRRATLNFDMAKHIYAKEKELDLTLKYAREARDLFQIKLRLDPFSSYGYVDFTKFEIWCLDKIEQTEEDHARQMIVIEDLIEQAERCVYDDLESVVKIKSDYLRNHKRITPEDRKAYLGYLDSLLANDNLRHLALILMFHFYRDEKNEEECSKIIAQLEPYKYLDAVAILLFNYYGRGLHIANNRSSLLKLLRENSKISERNPVNYHFFLYVAAAYNRYFGESYSHVADLKSVFTSYSPMYRDSWRDSESGNPVVFRGILFRGPGGRLKVRIVELQQFFGYHIKSGVIVNEQEGVAVDVVLHFYLSGIRGEIIGLP